MRATQQTRLPRISIVCEELLCRIIDKRHNEGTYFWRRKIRILRLCGKTLIVLQDCYWISCSLVLKKARCVSCALHIQCSFFVSYFDIACRIFCLSWIWNRHLLCQNNDMTYSRVKWIATSTNRNWCWGELIERFLLES